MKLLVVDASRGFTDSTWLAARWALEMRAAGEETGAVLTEDPDGPPRRVYESMAVPVLSGSIPIAADTVLLFTTIRAAPLLRRTDWADRAIWLIREGQSADAFLATIPDRTEIASRVAAIILPERPAECSALALLLRRVPAERIYFVPSGSETAPSGPVPGAASRAGPRVAMVGPVDLAGRQLDLLRAIAAAGAGYQADLIGRVGEVSDSLRRMVKENASRLRFLGELPHEQAMSVVADCHALVVDDEDSHASLSLIGSAARGVVPLLADGPAFRGIWQHGRNCLIHPSGDPAILAWSLRILAADPPLRQRLGEAARRTVSRFTVERFCEEMSRVLVDVRRGLASSPREPARETA
ncbi:MAG: glycosyltransferase family 4 protein [Rhodospirillales bacterium]|nr:glycosyltransferase family 4 protein [Rhodospirillales bacterium]